MREIRIIVSVCAIEKPRWRELYRKRDINDEIAGDAIYYNNNNHYHILS